MSHHTSVPQRPATRRRPQPPKGLAGLGGGSPVDWWARVSRGAAIGQLWYWGGAKAVAGIGAVTRGRTRSVRLGPNSSRRPAARSWEEHGSAVRLPASLAVCAAPRCRRRLQIEGPAGHGESKGAANPFPVQPRATHRHEGSAERWTRVPFTAYSQIKVPVSSGQPVTPLPCRRSPPLELEQHPTTKPQPRFGPLETALCSHTCLLGTPRRSLPTLEAWTSPGLARLSSTPPHPHAHLRLPGALQPLTFGSLHLLSLLRLNDLNLIYVQMRETEI